jgi:hypothetical protein
MHLHKREYSDAIFVGVDHDKVFSLLYQFIKNYDFIAAAATIRRKFF